MPSAGTTERRGACTTEATQGRRPRPSRRLPALGPALTLYFVFIGVPLIGSSCGFVPAVGPDIAGPSCWLSNYRQVAHDPQLGQTLSNTFLLDIMTTVVHLVPGDGPGTGGDQRAFPSSALLGPNGHRYTVPHVGGRGGPDVVVHPGRRYRAVQLLLDKDRVEPTKLAGLVTWGIPGLVIIDVWATLGFTFIIFLVGLADDPERTMYEAAAIDGAAGLRKFRNITLPMLSPATFIASMTAFIGAFEIFTWPLIDTNGGPGIATQTIVLYIYKSAFQNYQYGYSAVVSLINIGILISFAVVMAVMARRWVHYERV